MIPALSELSKIANYHLLQNFQRWLQAKKNIFGCSDWVAAFSGSQKFTSKKLIFQPVRTKKSLLWSDQKNTRGIPRLFTGGRVRAQFTNLFLDVPPFYLLHCSTKKKFFCSLVTLVTLNTSFTHCLWHFFADGKSLLMRLFSPFSKDIHGAENKELFTIWMNIMKNLYIIELVEQK